MIYICPSNTDKHSSYPLYILKWHIGAHAYVRSRDLHAYTHTRALSTMTHKHTHARTHTHKHKHTRTHARTHERAHTHTHTRARARTPHARTHTQFPKCNSMRIVSLCLFFSCVCVNSRMRWKPRETAG